MIKNNCKVLKTLALSITLCLVCANSIQVHAAENESFASETAQDTMYQEVDKMIAELDKNALIQDAINGVVDERVPAEFSTNVNASVDFIPADGRADMDFDVYSTVQKVGDILNEEGKSATLYVAVAAATEPKTEAGHTGKHGIDAYVYVYWIDKLGTDNELYAISAQWDTKDKDVSDRKATYGVMKASTFSFSKSTSVSISDDDYYEVVHGTYTGFILGCKSSINVTNLGTVTCSVHSRF